jgi:hypothetical protein
VIDYITFEIFLKELAKKVAEHGNVAGLMQTFTFIDEALL